ncbi:unnamed protein product [Ascophyllum nodosum]
MNGPLRPQMPLERWLRYITCYLSGKAAVYCVLLKEQFHQVDALSTTEVQSIAFTFTMCRGANKLESYPSELRPRRSPPTWYVMFYTPLEALLVATTGVLGFAAVMTTLYDARQIVPPVVAAAAQGTMVVLHGLCEGPRLQMLPVYVPAMLLALVATGFLGESWGVLIAVGISMLLLALVSLILCYEIPGMLPVGSRGPFAVGIATEHIRHSHASINGDLLTTDTEEADRWPLELMVQVFYPVEESCIRKLPWFPSTIDRFRKSLVPGWGGARRLPFGLTQAGVVGAAVILATVISSAPDAAQPLGKISSASLFFLLAGPIAWAVLFAVALVFTCFLSDLRLGSSRSAFKARYLAREQARRIAMFSSMPGWLTEPICGLYGPGFDAGYFHNSEVPCFPVAPLTSGEGKRPLVIFSHGLGGNRAMYSTYAAEIASHGYVLIALEHNDASGSSCLFPDGRVTGYERPPNPRVFNAPENRTFRHAQLERRGREIKLVRDQLAKLVRDLPSDFVASRRVGLGSILDTERPAFIGHSFGGGTVLHELSANASSSHDGDNARQTDYSMAFIMDPWTFPLSDEAQKQSVSIPMMIVTTDNFLGPEGVATEDRLAENATTLVREGANDLAMQLRVKDAEHNNFSDSPLFAPNIMRKIKSAGKMDPVAFIDQVSRLSLCNLEAFHRRRTKGGGLDSSQPLPDDLTSALIGDDLAAVFPEASVRRGCTGGVLPSSEV